MGITSATRRQCSRSWERGGLRQGAQAEQAGVVTVREGKLCLAQGLARIADDAGHLGEGATGLAQMLVNRLGGQFQHWFQQTVLGLVEFELGGMYTDGDTAGAGGAVVAGEGALAPLIELEVGGEGERVGGDDLPVAQMLSQCRRRGRLRHQKLPSRVSKWVGLSSVAPSFCTQAAIHWSIWCRETRG